MREPEDDPSPFPADDAVEPSSAFAGGDETVPDPGRREFIRRAGKAVIALSFLGSAGGALGQHPSPAPDIEHTCVRELENDPESNTTTDRDESCGDGNPDEACHIKSSEDGSSKDPDGNCGEKVEGSEFTDKDESCGDCDDNHEADENCGKAKNAEGELDRDEMCGHVSGVGDAESDDRCGKGGSGENVNPDEGCGNHETIYNDENDPDGNCGGKDLEGKTDPDSNCTGNPEGDAGCDEKPPAYMSSPDECCGNADQQSGGTDDDQACGDGGSEGYNPAYDEDESCGNGNSDSACDAHVDAWWLLVHLDETDTDNA